MFASQSQGGLMSTAKTFVDWRSWALSYLLIAVAGTAIWLLLVAVVSAERLTVLCCRWVARSWGSRPLVHAEPWAVALLVLGL